MSLKVKLTSTICAFLLILGLVITGVFAVPQATVNLGGSLTFNATDVYAKVSGVIAGTAATTQPTLETLEFKAGTTTDVSSWSNVPLTFTDAGSAITITVTIENQATDRPLYAKISDSIGEVEALTKSMKQGEAAYAGDVLELPASTGAGTSTATITLSIEVANKNASLTNASYGYAIDLSNEEIVEESILTYDSENGYYYVEMGTYNSQPVKWRLVSTDGESKFVANGNNAPTSGQGWFIQETVTSMSMYNSNDSTNDYATSEIKTYLDTYNTVLGLSSADPTYSKIQSRNMAELYEDINWDRATGTISSGETTNTDDVNFWLPSVKEIYTMIAGETVSLNATLAEGEWYQLKDVLNWSSTNYLFRSPCDDPGSVYGIDSTSPLTINGFYVAEENNIRPMFVLNF